MTFHVCAWEEDIDPGGAMVNIAAVPEQVLTSQGDDIRVPRVAPYIIGAAIMGNHASMARGQVQSPSLRIQTNLDIEPLVPALVFGSPPEGSLYPDSPVQVVPDESLNIQVESTPGAAAIHRALVLLSEGPQSPVLGNHFTVRATTAITLATGTWVNGVLVFSQVLPAGRYAVIGMRARGTNLVAMRLVFQEQTLRPGVLAVNVVGDLDPRYCRFGRMGVFGEFESTNPPTADALGVTDSAQVLLLDLVRVR